MNKATEIRNILKKLELLNHRLYKLKSEIQGKQIKFTGYFEWQTRRKETKTGKVMRNHPNHCDKIYAEIEGDEIPVSLSEILEVLE